MKLLIVVIICYVFVEVSEVNCVENITCKELFRTCSNDEECCFKKCRFSFTSLNNICTYENSTIDSMETFFSPKNKNGICSYMKSLDSNENDKIFRKIGLNSAHTLLSQVLKVFCRNQDSHCRRLNEKCIYDSDCCSHSCNSLFYLFNGNCDLSKKIAFDFKSLFKENNITCSFYKKNGKVKTDLYKRFNINAEYSLLPPNTKIKVTYNNQDVVVTINDLNSKKNRNRTMELSEEAAIVLGITEEGTFPCSVNIPEIPFSQKYKTALKSLSVFGIFLSMWLFMK